MPLKIKTSFSNLIESSFSDVEKMQIGKNNTFLSLRRLKSYGYSPAYIIDIGAHVGNWTQEVYKIFPSASYIAIEPLPDKRIVLEQSFKNMPVKIYNSLLGGTIKKNVPFYSMETGSSVLEELTDFSREIIYLDMLTLDEIARFENLKGQILLKLDVQGFELEILKGATSVLDMVDVICMEISFLNYNEGAPLAHEVILKMKEWGFVTYDITGFIRKDNDFALVQSDFIFMKVNNKIRNKINNMKGKFNLITT